ncbi:uncharacterized protein LOC124594225 [Schistocerca americana]|uniref:uncharacterized protein LOC124594225 n=1 Tax=Schistocerca americana TaxID=7009 RepID=UPI001F4FC0CE|nr:uncharacterized protein LOC124594225 [Schistocerca americana]
MLSLEILLVHDGVLTVGVLMYGLSDIKAYSNMTNMLTLFHMCIFAKEFCLFFKRHVFCSLLKDFLLNTGFMSTGDSLLPGNLGMKDQVLTLKCIKQNIKAFGGNPDEVTIAGQSSGGSVVHCHLLSPLSKVTTCCHHYQKVLELKVHAPSPCVKISNRNGRHLQKISETNKGSKSHCSMIIRDIKSIGSQKFVCVCVLS